MRPSRSRPGDRRRRRRNGASRHAAIPNRQKRNWSGGDCSNTFLTTMNDEPQTSVTATSTASARRFPFDRVSTSLVMVALAGYANSPSRNPVSFPVSRFPASPPVHASRLTPHAWGSIPPLASVRLRSPRALRALPDRLAPRRRGAHGALQPPLRPRDEGPVHPAHRGHGRRALPRGAHAPDPLRDGVARPRLRRRAFPPVGAHGALPVCGRAPDRGGEGVPRL